MVYVQMLIARHRHTRLL